MLDDARDPGAATLGPEDGSDGSASDPKPPTARDAATTRAAPEAPRRLGRYVLLGVLGRGGMGVVYEARDQQVNRTVALKLLHAGLGGRRAERLRREARALARLSHPNVVSVYEVGHHDDCWFIAMELVPGKTLRDWQHDRPAWRECVRTYLQAGRGLAAAHAAGITHRDFKPSNCILDGHGRVRVVDFGLARQAEDASADPASSDPSPASDAPAAVSLTRTGEVLGTLGYMPFEQLTGKPADARSDQWSFCASLYEALYGERPFVAEAIGALTLALMSEQIRPAPGGSRVPRRLRRVLLRGLAKHPEARWPSMDALLAELEIIAGARRTRWALAAGGLLVAGVGLGLVLSEPAAPTIATPIDPPDSQALAEDGRPPSPEAALLRERAEEDYAARRIDALRDHLDRIAPSGSLPDDPTLAAEVLLWRGRIAEDVEEGATLLRQAYALAHDADVPSIEARAAGAMMDNPAGAHAEGVDTWLRLAWVAAERVPWERSTAIEVAVTAAHSFALTWSITNDREHARALLEFADSVVGGVELEDDAFVAMYLSELAGGWVAIEEHARGQHWSLAARQILSATADPTHPVWPDVIRQLGHALHAGERGDDCLAAVPCFEAALAGYLALGEGERASIMRVAIAGCLRRMGRFEASLEQARAAADYWAHHPPVYLANQQHAHLLIGRVLADLGRTEDARAEFERIVSSIDIDSSAQRARQLAREALEELGPPAKDRKPVKGR